MVNSEISSGLVVPLDCPPFGKQNVRFDAENSSSEILPIIVTQWVTLWPRAYVAIADEAKACGTKIKPENDMKITVVLPASSLKSGVSWTIDLGDFSAKLKGTKVTGASSY